MLLTERQLRKIIRRTLLEGFGNMIKQIVKQKNPTEEVPDEMLDLLRDELEIKDPLEKLAKRVQKIEDRLDNVQRNEDGTINESYRRRYGRGL